MLLGISLIFYPQQYFVSSIFWEWNMLIKGYNFFAHKYRRGGKQQFSYQYSSKFLQVNAAPTFSQRTYDFVQ